MEDSFVERLLKRLENRGVVGPVIWVVVLSAIISVLINLFTAPEFGSNLDTWLENWFSDFSSDLIAAGVVFLFVKAFLDRREKQKAGSGERGLITEQAASEQAAPKTFTYYIEAERVSAPGANNQQADEDVEDAVDNLAEALQTLIAELKEVDTPEARQVHLDRVRDQGVFVKSTLIGLNLQRADLHSVNMSNSQLVKANFREANLQGINLQGANLKETQLIEADLRGANLTDAILEHTFLSGANLNGAKLGRAKIQTSLWGVSLINADLQDADLRESELFKTNLTGANLVGANFEDAKFSTDMILPDGTNWNEKTEMKRFTDPSHPDFWRSDDPKSPAYRGETAEVTVEETPAAEK